MLNTRNEEKNTVFYSCLSLFCDYIHLEYVRIHVIYRVKQAEYVIHILAGAPQEYVNIYSTHRILTPLFPMSVALSDAPHCIGTPMFGAQ